jgi:hypothetical protein
MRTVSWRCTVMDECPKCGDTVVNNVSLDGTVLDQAKDPAGLMRDEQVTIEAEVDVALAAHVETCSGKTKEGT